METRWSVMDSNPTRRWASPAMANQRWMAKAHGKDARPLDWVICCTKPFRALNPDSPAAHAVILGPSRESKKATSKRRSSGVTEAFCAQEFPRSRRSHPP